MKHDPDPQHCRVTGQASAPTVGRQLLLAAVPALALAFLGPALVAAQTPEPIAPIPFQLELDQRKVNLGEALFHDVRLSKDNENACSSCHDLDNGGDDGLAKSKGLGGKAGKRNTLTIFNSTLNFRMMWDGRFASSEQQVEAAIHDPAVMGTTWPAILDKLAQDQALTQAFAGLYPQGMQPQTITDALVVYERSLITPNARFDRFLRGDAAALDPDELEGYRLFKTYGCASCHQGVNVGGNMFQVFGVLGMPGDYFRSHGPVADPDFGLYNTTKAEEDKFVFRVPSLRNVALTAPYFNDGSAATLTEAVDAMAKYQLGRQIPPRDNALIVAFLRTLTGEYKGRPLDARVSQ
ncbi:c-type cytochrome [Mycobacterium sp. KBS0706]|uniref:cytochrome-c peroxidase n=1 Tax=Mycobacterium sp. KBS0706 TaxID=2578109 RepID=UPI00110FEB48|nr:cytochrome c peroxidase [Mycobacterium sp. KBS0706]TSD89878.1 c-type cytochrome [Mycobacterium sp. KBS0706]